MANYTQNLNLYKVNPATDGNNIFDINKILNENWDKIDNNVTNNLTVAKQYTDNAMINISNNNQMIIVNQVNDYVDTRMTSILGTPPGDLNNLQKIAAAINNDPYYNTTIITSINNVGTAANNYTDIKISGVTGTPPTALNNLQKIATAINNDPNYNTTITTAISSAQTNATSAAKTYTDGQITTLTTGAPANLNTFKELATAINNDPNYSTTINTALTGKSNAGKLTASQLNDTKLASGFYTNSGDGLLNGDATTFKSGWWHVQVSYHYDNNGFGMQIATPLNNAVEARYYRTSNGTTWDAWRKILDQRDYDTLFQYANDGKTAVANAITAKGVSASSGDTFSSLATKIGNISTGRKFASGTAPVTSTTVTVSGLGFQPSMILLYDSASGYKTIYESRVDLDTGDWSTFQNCVVMGYNCWNQPKWLNGSTTGDSFSIPIYAVPSSGQCTWFAWE